MKRASELVATFHRAVGHPVREATTTLTAAEREHRLGLLDEEMEELREALDEGDALKIAREAADVEFVLHGLAHYVGFDLDAATAEVARANMAKIGPDGLRTRGDGKVLKPEGWTPPDLTRALKVAA